MNKNKSCENCKHYEWHYVDEEFRIELDKVLSKYPGYEPIEQLSLF